MHLKLSLILTIKMNNKKKRICMDELQVALDELTPLEENNKKLGELIELIKILNSNLSKLLTGPETSYIS